MRDADGDTGPLGDSELEALFAPFAEAKLIALAVSGGADSLALMVGAARWRRLARGRPALLVLTVDHRLRRGSGDEAAAVAAAAKGRRLKAEVLVRTGAKPAGDVEAAARRARYRLLFAAARAAGASHLLTAHHRDDVAETFLMRLQRGAGVFGLAAMRPAIPVGDVVLARPFLDVPRARLAATVAAAGLDPVADPMNADPRFALARIRAAMPQLAWAGVDAGGIAATARRLAATADAIDAAASAFLATAVTVDDHAVARLDASAFRDAPEAVATRALTRLLLALGGEDYPPRYRRLMGLAEALRTSNGSRLKRTLAGTVVEGRGDALVFYREIGRDGLGSMPLKPGTSVVWDHRFRLTAEPSAASGMNVQALGEAARRDRFSAGNTPMQALAALPAVVRRGRILCIPALEPARAKGIIVECLLSRRIAQPPLFPDVFAGE